jgi:hypothetical protein
MRQTAFCSVVTFVAKKTTNVTIAKRHTYNGELQNGKSQNAPEKLDFSIGHIPRCSGALKIARVFTDPEAPLLGFGVFHGYRSPIATF